MYLKQAQHTDKVQSSGPESFKVAKPSVKVSRGKKPGVVKGGGRRKLFPTPKQQTRKESSSASPVESDSEVEDSLRFPSFVSLSGML